MKIRILATVFVSVLSTVASVNAELIYALSSDSQILSFNSTAPGSILSAHGITGLQPVETLLGIDARPTTGLLYALGSSSRLYTINPNTGAATQVGSGQFGSLLNGLSFGYDFSSAGDVIRATSDLDQNLRINPTTGAIVAVDTTLAYAGGDTFAGQNPSINGLAYNNSGVLFAIDSLQNSVSTIGSPSPNDGTIHTVGLLGIDVSRVNGFDISTTSGIAYLGSPAASSDPGANLYTVNPITGVASLLGHIGAPDQDIIIQGITVAVPEPGIGALFAFGSGFGCLMLWKRRRS